MKRAAAVRLSNKLRRIARLASESLDLLGDDPMVGELWSALNRIQSDASDSLNEHLPAVGGRSC